MLKHQQWRNEKYEERRKNYIEWIGEDTNHGQKNIVGVAMLKHQQWRKKYEERRKNYIEWIGEDTNHGQ